MKHHGLGASGTVHFVFAFYWALALLLSPAMASDTPTVAQKLEALSTEFYAFNMSNFLSGYNRLEMGPTEATARNTTCDAEQKKYEAWIAKLLTIEADKETLRPLLKHPNPRVRTLAMALLINANDPSVLPDIADLLEDDAVTFFGPSIKYQIAPPGGSPLAKNATVGSNARSVMWFYIHPATWKSDYQDEFIVPKSGRTPFDEYWSTHKDLKYCASWFAVKIRHGGKHSANRYPEYQSHLQKIHAEIDQLPEPDRTWTLLWLSFDSYTGPITSKEELISLLQKMDPAIILDILGTQQIPSRDPDIRLNPGAQRQMVRFLFKHSDLLTSLHDAEVVRRYRAEFEKGEPPPFRRSSSSRGKGQSNWDFEGAAELPQPPSRIEFSLEPNTPTPP